MCNQLDIILINLQGMIIPRVERLDTYAVDATNPQPGSVFFVPLGQTVMFYCYCQCVLIMLLISLLPLFLTSQYRNYEMVQILHNETVVHPWQSCSTVLHIIRNVSISDEGMYTCRVQDASNHVCDRPLGNLSAISKSKFNSYACNNIITDQQIN